MNGFTTLASLLPLLEILSLPVLGFAVMMIALSVLEFVRAEPVLRIPRGGPDRVLRDAVRLAAVSDKGPERIERAA